MSNSSQYTKAQQRKFSLAGKKSWVTRRANIAKAKRSAAAKKAAATRRSTQS